MGKYNRAELKAKIKVIQDAGIGPGLGDLRYLLILSYLESIEALLKKLVGGISK